MDKLQSAVLKASKYCHILQEKLQNFCITEVTLQVTVAVTNLLQ